MRRGPNPGARLEPRDLDRFGVSVEGVVEVEVFGGQALLSVVLREAPQDRPVTPCRVADDLPTSRPGSDRDGLENDAAGAVYCRLDKVSFTEVCLSEHVRRQRHDAAVAYLAHMNHGHTRTSLFAATVYTVATVVNRDCSHKGTLEPTTTHEAVGDPAHGSDDPGGAPQG